MIFQDSYEKIRRNFAMLEDFKQRQRQMNIIELAFIIFSIVIMIPYEMVYSYKWLTIIGGLNLMCDIVFVVLLYRLWFAYKKGVASNFLLITDFLAAFPGIAAILVLMIATLITKDFNGGEFLAAGGLSLPALKTTKFLRILRVTRLFRVVRNIKLLKFIALKSDSNSAEMAVGWLGFILLVLLIISNFLFILVGPISIQEDSYYKLGMNLEDNLIKSNPQISPEVFAEISKGNLKDKLVYIEISGERKYYNEFSGIEPSKADLMIKDKFCSLNSSQLKLNDIVILLDDKEVFYATKRNNLIWISAIIFSVLIFSIIATVLIGKNFTDYMNDYRKVIIDSYQGIESSFNLDAEKLSKNDRDSFAYAVGLYTQDFVRLVAGLKDLESQLKLKDQEIEDLNFSIQDLEKELDSIPAGGGDEETIKDLDKSIKLIKKLCSKNPSLLNKIRASIKFKTISL